MTLSKTTEITVDTSFRDAPANWLLKQAHQYGLRYLLAHADDGVIWGRIDGNTLVTSHEIALYSPELRAVTLQQCRLFGVTGELLLWRDAEHWRGRYANDEIAADYIDEDQILWGSAAETPVKGFTRVTEGAQGMRHAVPVVVTSEQLEARQLRLRVRHYIDYNDDGEARIVLSRLVQLLPETA